jgi:2-hydroxychromene-2-carboxylate isomerase
MKHIHRLFIFSPTKLLLSALFVTQSIAKQNNTYVLLAKIYKRGIDVREYLVSKKYDGVRAVWDDHTFHKRTGLFAGPTWFTNNLPKLHSLMNCGLATVNLMRFLAR